MYKALIESLLTYNDNTKKIQLANEGFTGDSGDFSQKILTNHHTIMV